MARLRRSKKARGFLVLKPQGQLTPRVQAVGPEHFGVVSIDVAKARSKFLLCNFYGTVLIEPTPIEHTQAGFRAAVDQIRAALRRHQLRDVVVAIESTGAYHRPVQEAFRKAGFETRLVHPYATKQFRQPADPGNKTDDTDLAGIHRAAVNGFGFVQPLWPDDWLDLQQFVRQRRDLVYKIIVLRCQIKETLHHLMPGYAELFGAHLFDTPVALPLARATGSAQALLDAGLDGLRQRLPENLRYQQATLVKILHWGRSAAPAPGPWQPWREHLDRLCDDFFGKTQQIHALEQRSAALLTGLPYVVLLALPGINVVSAAELAGELGPISHYANANRITGRAGLVPSRYQSDQVDHANGPLRRRANRRLRAALLQIADNLIRHNHHYQARAHLWQRLKKDPRWIHVKVAKSFSRLAFVMLTGACVFPHPACQPRHSILEKLLAFHSEHHTDHEQTMRDIEHAAQHLPGRARQQETQLLQALLDQPETRRRRGPVALAKIIPLVLAQLRGRVLPSEPEGQDPR